MASSHGLEPNGLEPQPIAHGSSATSLPVPASQPRVESVGSPRLRLVTETEGQVPFVESVSSTRYLLNVAATSTPLMLSDAAAVIGSLAGVWGIGSVLGAVSSLPSVPFLLGGLGFPMLMGAGCYGLYPAVGIHPAREFRNLMVSAAAAFGMFIVFGLTAGALGPAGVIVSVLAGLMAMFLVPIARFTAREVMGRFTWWTSPALVLGSDSETEEISRSLRANRSRGLRPVLPADVCGETLPAEIDETWLAEHCDGIDWAVVGSREFSRDASVKALDACRRHFTNVVVIGDQASQSVCRRPTLCGGQLGERHRNKRLVPLTQGIKRAFDFSVGLTLGIAILPLVAFFALVIKTLSPGPLFFGHERIGRNGQRFKAWKFRSMVVNADKVLEKYLAENPEYRAEWERDHKLKNDPRIIPGVGQLLRKLSLDELPQIWNILRGEMSLVGPRPIVTAEIPKYGDVYPMYLSVTPGVTGLWQVSGRNNTTYDERIAYDAFYVRNWSLSFDLYILLRTVKTVLLGEGAY